MSERAGDDVTGLGASTRTASPVVHTGGAWVGPKVVRIPDLFSGDVMLTRYVIFRTPWGGVQLHRWHRPDNDRDMHNHPRGFWTLILRGGYSEVTPAGMRHWRAGSARRIRLGDRHSVKALHRVPTWSLVVVGPKRQEWGFFTPDGFVRDDDYHRYVEANYGR